MAFNTETFPEIPTTPPANTPPPPEGPPPKKRRGGFFRKALVALLILGVVVVFGAIGYLKWTEGRIERIPAAELTSLQEPAGGGEVRNFLVVGTDDRESMPDDWDQGFFGEFAGRRADVIMLAHMVPGERVQLLSIPRDLKVTIPGNGTNRINAAYVVGGPDLLVQAVQDETGIPIHHYVEIDFGGFGSIVDSLGGVTVDFPYAARDDKSGLSIEAGTQRLNGEQAVAYARSRHYLEYRDGSWQSTPGGDIARTQRQQEILVRLFDQVTSPSAAFNLPGFLPTLADNITADQGLSLGTMAEIGRSALTLRSGDIERATLPVRNSSGDDGRSYVVPTGEAAAVLEAFLTAAAYSTD